MKIPTKKLKTGFEMPVFGLGTWQMGGRTEHDPLNDDDRDINAIKACIDSEITHIDTAEYYANGYAEILVGKALKGCAREKLFIVSKVMPEHMSYQGIINACKESLTRLELDYLDLYLLHKYNPKLALNESVKALDYLVEQGLVRNIGVCNFTKEHLAEAQSYTKNKIVCNQVHYNLIFREPETTGLVKYCQENDVFLSAWRPIQKGGLLENIPPILQEMCDKYKKTPAQIAINWLISQPKVITLSKMSNKEHISENLNALNWQMEAEDIEKLRKEFPGQQFISDAVPLG